MNLKVLERYLQDFITSQMPEIEQISHCKHPTCRSTQVQLRGTQIWSKNYRELNDTYGAAFLLDELYEKMYAPNFKKAYRGKPTWIYQNLMKKINDIEGR